MPEMEVSTWLPTLPLPPNTERAVIETDRLILRPFQADDVNALHQIRTQEEVMTWTAAGVPDRDLAETQAKLDQWLAPNDAKTFNYAICWKETGRLVGIGGCHLREGHCGWPEIGYLFNKQYWGQGLATEFLKAFVKEYAQLPRSKTTVRVPPASLLAAPAADGPETPVEACEILTAVVDATNNRSESVMKKGGFERFMTVVEPDSHDPDVSITLEIYRLLVKVPSGQEG